MKPKDISEKLPKLISLIRIIWVNSPHYNTRERLTALFRKVGAGSPCWQGSESLADVRWKGPSTGLSDFRDGPEEPAAGCGSQRDSGSKPRNGGKDRLQRGAPPPFPKWGL